MKKNNKKGFTVVELVIVVAVIGVLSAVLIPVFMNLTAKANQAADDTLVKNLNTALQTQEGVPGDTKNNTLHDAVVELEDYGYKLTNLLTKSHDNNLLWNRKTNRFLLDSNLAQDKANNSSKNMKNVDYFHIQDNLENPNGYSIYAGNGFNLSNVENLTVGFDAGVKEISSINYVGSEGNDIVIRTNSFDTNLTINAPLDSVEHYDAVGSLNIIAVKNNSFHEHGQVKFVEISTGRFAIEEGAEVNHIHINAKEDESGEKLNEFAEVIISYDESIEFTEVGFSRDDVEIAPSGTLVVALQAGTEEVSESTDLDYVWLTKQGVYEQIKVSDSSESAGETWVNTSSKSDETKEAAKQIANNIGRDEQGNVSSTVEINETEYKVGFDEDRNMTLTQNGTTDTEDVVIDGETTTTTATSSVTVFTITDNGMVSTTTTTTTVTTQVAEEEPSVVETTQTNQTEYVTEGDTTTATNYTIDEDGNKTQVGDTTTATAEETALISDVSIETNNNVEKPTDKEDIQTGSILFDGGSGTKNDPYRISNAEQWDNFYQVCYDWEGDFTPCFALTQDIDLTGKDIHNFAYKADGSISYGFFMNFDLNGNGHSIIGIQNLKGYCQLFPYIWDSNIHDITINYNIDESRTSAMVYYPVGDNYFTNVKTTGHIYTTANWSTAYVAYMYKEPYSNYSCNVFYTNCINEASIKGSFGNNGYSAVFGSHNGGGGHITFDRCVNYGGVLGGYVGFVGMGNDSAYTFVDENAVKNYGSMTGTKDSGYFNYNSTSATKTISGVTCNVKQPGSNASKSSTHTNVAPANYGDIIMLNEVEGAFTYEVEMSFTIQVYNYDDGQNANRWSGGFPRSMQFTFTADDVVDHQINTGLKKSYVGEIKENQYYGYSNTNPTYNGIFVSEGFDLHGEDVEIIENQGDIYYVKYQDQYFLVMYSEEYPGWYGLLCTNTEGQVTTQNVTIYFSVTAYNPNGSVLSFSNFSYNVNVQDAISFFQGLNTNESI